VRSVWEGRVFAANRKAAPKGGHPVDMPLDELFVRAQ